MQVIADLYNLDLTQTSTQEIFSDRTRDNDQQVVLIDTESEIIFLKDPTSHFDAYKSGNYRQKTVEEERSDAGHIEDATRRCLQFRKLIDNRDIAEFGCGNGLFLLSSRKHATSVTGVELQDNFVTALKRDSIDCFSDLNSLPDKSFDSIFLFHVFEHLEDPIAVLKELKYKLKPKGKLVIEVPHARDCLLKTYNSEAFKQHTLWSQHIVLHTQESLRRFCNAAGLNIEGSGGIQRYGLSNHLRWLTQSNLSPDAQQNLSFSDDNQLGQHYVRVLKEQDITDTIYCIAN